MLDQALRGKANEVEVQMTVNHFFPSEKHLDSCNDNELESLSGTLGIHKKLSGWYKEVMGAEDPYRSNVLFLEIKMRELLGEAWKERTTKPDVVRASISCDMLGRLLEATPAIKELGLTLLEELTFSIFQSRTGTGTFLCS